MLQKAHVVYADDNRYRAREWSSILHMQQAGTVFPHLQREIEPETHKWVSRDSTGANVSRQGPGGTLRRHVGNELVVLTLGGKCVQEAPNVYLITREVAADGVSINGETH
jgi:hypothetical protein